MPQEAYVLAILRAARRLEAEGDRLFLAHRLTVPQFNVLNLLQHYQPMPQSELVQQLVVGKASVSSVLAGLQKRGLVIQTLDPKDRRAKILLLSPQGAELWKKASRVYLDGLRKRFPGMDAAVVQALERALGPCST